eukprot:snap_masked-scaffold_83-processed-gene-0.19-mRNA-1 protein AED:1.00 eAED:1.00 QI:0/0/0/0/1/1/2/0/228
MKLFVPGLVLSTLAVSQAKFEFQDRALQEVDEQCFAECVDPAVQIIIDAFNGLEPDIQDFVLFTLQVDSIEEVDIAGVLTTLFDIVGSFEICQAEINELSQRFLSCEIVCSDEAFTCEEVEQEEVDAFLAELEEKLGCAEDEEPLNACENLAALNAEFGAAATQGLGVAAFGTAVLAALLNIPVKAIFNSIKIGVKIKFTPVPVSVFGEDVSGFEGEPELGSVTREFS